MLKTLLKKVSVLFILAATCCFFSCDLGAKDDSSNSDDDNEPITEITLKKLFSNENPNDYWYSYSNQAEKVITDFETPASEEIFILELSGKVSKDYAAPLVLYLENTDNTDQCLQTCRMINCKANESFKTLYVFKLPAYEGQVDKSKIDFELFYVSPFFDNEITFTDFSLKQIKEEELEEPLLKYNYHIGPNTFIEYNAPNINYNLIEPSAYSSEVADFFLNWMFGDMWYLKHTGVYENSDFTGEPITKIAAADNTKERDFYINYDFIARRNEWDNNGKTEHNYGGCLRLPQYGINELPEPNSSIAFTVSGKTSIDFNGTVTANVFDDTDGKWQWLCNSQFKLNLKAGEVYTEKILLNIPADAKPASVNDLKLEFIYSFADISKEQQFYVSDLKVTKIPNPETITFTYHFGNASFTKSILKESNALLPSQDQWWNEFNGFYTSMDFYGWYDNAYFTGSAINSISEENNTTNRDFYAKCKYKIGINKWGSTPDDYGYSGGPALNQTIKDIGIPKNGSKLIIEVKGIPSATVDLPMQFKLWDWTRTENQMVCISAQTVHLEKNKAFKFAYVLEIPSDANLTENSNLWLDFVYFKNYLDEELTISDIAFKQLDEKDLLTYSYYIGANEQIKYVAKGYDYVLPVEFLWWDSFNRGFTTQSFLGWYDNPEFTGDSISLISAEENTINKKFYGKWALKMNHTYWEGDEFYSNMTRFQEILPEIITVPTAGKTYKLHFTGTVPKEGEFSFTLTNIVINGDNEKWEHFDNGGFCKQVAQGAYDFTIDVLIPESAKFDSLHSAGLKICFSVSDKQYTDDSLIINDFKVEVVE